MVLEDEQGHLLGARIAADGQWRFPFNPVVPDKMKVCMTLAEDRYFQYHSGISWRSIGRAIFQNTSQAKVVSGGSTITMQVARLMRHNPPRHIFNKLWEMLVATRLEWRYSKDEILALYLSNAPFGGNVVGLDAAAWRYYGKSANALSWGEAATLAVLPNAPGLIHPGRNREALLAKRNLLLDELHQTNYLDSLSCALAKEEPLPDKPLPLPRHAVHLIDRAWREQFRGQSGKITKLQTTLNGALQNQAERILLQHSRQLRGNGIANLSALIMDVETGNVLAYVGNTPDDPKFQIPTDIEDKYQKDVDCIMAKRSTGSILKPLLFANMLNDGAIITQNLVPDIPWYADGFRPTNFAATYDGMVTASKAISRSLNVPLVQLLQAYGVETFIQRLQKAGFTSVNKSAKHYGLSLILGGAECRLWELVGVYGSMARVLNHYNTRQQTYDNAHDWHMPNYNYKTTSITPQLSTVPNVLTASAIWQTFQTMREVERPRMDGAWEIFQSARQVAWKTGTSFGFRDAWSVGVTPRYVVGVWAGNADGEGRPGLIGVQVAAPILFDLLACLPPEGTWFQMPSQDLMPVAICHESGYRCSADCPHRDTVLACKTANLSAVCRFHRIVHLDSSATHLVDGNCYPPSLMRNEAWFVLPPVEEFYYAPQHPQYKTLPMYLEGCGGAAEEQTMQLIYPKSGAKLFLPVNNSGELSKIIARVACKVPNAKLFWHLDNMYLGTTETFHELAIQPTTGAHHLVVIDALGHSESCDFETFSKVE